MARALSVTTPATTQIITTAVAKTYLKVDVSDDDTLIDNLIKAATHSAEEYTNRYFEDTVLKMVGDTWTDIATLYKSPVISVSSIKYYDSDDSQQTLHASVYLVDTVSNPCQISLQVDQSFPNLSNRAMAVEVNYTVGDSAESSATELITQAVLLLVGHWYQNRESVVVGRTATEVPLGAKMLLDQYKIQVCR